MQAPGTVNDQDHSPAFKAVNTRRLYLYAAGETLTVSPLGRLAIAVLLFCLSAHSAAKGLIHVYPYTLMWICRALNKACQSVMLPDCGVHTHTHTLLELSV